MNCPGSIRLSAGLPNLSSVYAKEGTAAHELGERCLLLDQDAIRFVGEEIEVEGDKFEVTEEMAEAVQVYLDTVRSDMEAGDRLAVEEKFDLSDVYPGMFGMNDSSLFKIKKKKLYVYDYKHGRGIAVDAEENPQLKYYGIGALLQSGQGCREVELVIVQPRAFHPDGPVRRWALSTSDLLDFAGELAVAAKRTEDPDAEVVAGDHCTFCPAEGLCPAKADKAMQVARNEFSDVRAKTVDLPDPDLLSVDELALVLDGSDMLETWLKAVRARAHNMAELGTEIPGYRLVAKRAVRKWAQSDVKTAAALNVTFGLDHDDIYKEPAVRSPAQVEKLLKKSDRESLAELVTKESSGANLVRDSTADPRPALAPKAAREFSAVEGNKNPATALF